jgi:signal transduction histidine kinase
MTGEPIEYVNFSRELGKYYDTYVFSSEQDTFAVVFNDVTDKIKAEEAVHQLNKELSARVQELEAKNTELEQFTYTVSHDLKAPIITIKGFLGFLEKDIFDGKQEHVHKDVVRIDEAVDKMHRLLSELLELSRIGRMMNQPETIPFNELVQDALDNVHGRLEPRGITVQILSPQGTQPNLPAVHGDRQRLTEVLQNLLDNAAKYMGAQSDPRIEIGQYGEDNGKPIFFVRDNGIGIAPEYHERIFGLFNKLDPRSDGTGIGLALVKRIVEVHGGRVWVESDGVPGKGSTFYFTLPGS